MRYFMLFVTVFTLSCVDNQQRGDVLYERGDVKILGNMKDSLLTDTLYCFKNNILMLKQYWVSGRLQQTEFKFDEIFRETMYVNKQIDSVTFNQYYTDKIDTSLRLSPYDYSIVHFYDSIKKFNTNSFTHAQETKFEIFNFPQELYEVAVAGGNPRKLNGELFIEPTRREGDSLKIYIFIKVLFTTQKEVFPIEG